MILESRWEDTLISTMDAKYVKREIRFCFFCTIDGFILIVPILFIRRTTNLSKINSKWHCTILMFCFRFIILEKVHFVILFFLVFISLCTMLMRTKAIFVCTSWTNYFSIANVLFVEINSSKGKGEEGALLFSLLRLSDHFNRENTVVK